MNIPNMDFTTFDLEYPEAESSNAMSDDFYPEHAEADATVLQGSPPRRAASALEISNATRFENVRASRSLSVTTPPQLRSTSQQSMTRARPPAKTGTNAPMSHAFGYSKQLLRMQQALGQIQRAQAQMQRAAKQNADLIQKLDGRLQKQEATMAKLFNDMLEVNKQTNHLQVFMTTLQEDSARANQSDPSLLKEHSPPQDLRSTEGGTHTQDWYNEI